jgi:methionyl-tRNA formyltransferase
MGTPQVAAATLERLIEEPDPVVGVVTQPDRPAGRGQKSVPSPVRRLAEQHNIPVLAAEKIRSAEFLMSLQAWHPDIIVVVAYGRILPSTILESAPHGCVNVHYSLLPKYRGAAPAAWAIINGEPETGVTTMKLVEKMDAGAIYLQQSIPLTGNETTGSLQTKLTPIGAELLLETLRRMKDGILIGRAQDESLASLAPMLKKTDGLIDWTRPAREIARRIRGFDPWPGSYTYIAGRLLKIHRATPLADDHSAHPGIVLGTGANGFRIGTGSGALLLDEVQLENKNRLSGVEFVRGARIKAGERLQ